MEGIFAIVKERFVVYKQILVGGLPDNREYLSENLLSRLTFTKERFGCDSYNGEY